MDEELRVTQRFVQSKGQDDGYTIPWEITSTMLAIFGKSEPHVVASSNMTNDRSEWSVVAVLDGLLVSVDASIDRAHWDMNSPTRGEPVTMATRVFSLSKVGSLDVTTSGVGNDEKMWLESFDLAMIDGKNIAVPPLGRCKDSNRAEVEAIFGEVLRRLSETIPEGGRR